MVPPFVQTVPAVLNSQFHVCISLAPRQMTVIFGLGMGLRLCMRTTLENVSYATESNWAELRTVLSTKVNL